ncbi:MAG: Response regulator receiver protein [Parcubacteria group bacterium GW2011_GWD2_38_11]|nr:MAG: Response regulator receiver protein [Parcubacteria group bacterium GW2011_GWD2_38_11]
MENKKKIILVVDDDADLLELAAIGLSAKGFEVLQAKDGKEAMEWLDRKGDEISLILLDIVMPEMDGFEVLEAMQKNEKYRKIPVIVNSNLDSDTDRQQSFALGAKDFFEKVKLDPGEVADKVVKFLEEKNS